MFFDGRQFARSSDALLSGQDLAVEGVVVVSVNYRLNVFGFLCLGTEQARGNYGILDQYFSLLWVRENIRFFGGDPQKITLFGHDSGAASVVLHMVSPRTAGSLLVLILESAVVIETTNLKVYFNEQLFHLEVQSHHGILTTILQKPQKKL